MLPALYRERALTKIKTLNRTNIEWVKNPDGSKGYVWNPVWGCLHNCVYCYAQQLAQRFGKTEDQKAFNPTWLQSNFDKIFPKKPSKIFVNSMSDIRWWEKSWMRKVLNKIEAYPKHSFLFLTKKPDMIYDFFDFYAPDNCWFGTTITNNDFPPIPLSSIHINFLSIEPILEAIPGLRKRHIPEKPLDWIIIGAETGNRKGKVIPKREWITEIVDYCRVNRIPVFLKDSLREIWGEKLIQEFPE